ncbi:hypothetical protein BU16DRAFT_560090 [Lophium mytilinum]|uniref:NACHT domain-containing protein n=1 Tax=Lophium mytilinum TaxID=390894 RepID=A0A6A6QYR2_9PEZI|nr:hypothetical protein BU16DRAFT_560090 [Lophium mytilinum]
MSGVLEAAGAIGTIWSVVTTARTVYDFFNDLKSANEDCKKIVKELYSSMRTLETIHSIGKDHPEKLHDLNSLFVSGGTLDQYRDTVDDLASRVLQSKGTKRAIKKLNFVLGKETVDSLLLKLGRHEDTFLMCLGTENLRILLSMDDKLNSLGSIEMLLLRIEGRFDAIQQIPKVTEVKPFHVPFARDQEDIIKREILMAKIDQTFNAYHRVALYGLGGTGKSRLAIEYMYRIREASKETAIFWVYAAGEPQFRNSYLSIYDTIPKDFKKSYEQSHSVPESPDVRSETLAVVQSWLQSEGSGPWLMVLDNADDPEVILKSEPGAVQATMRQYLPGPNKGRILITSRRKDVALSLVSGDNCLVHIEHLQPDEATRFFRKLLPNDPASDEIVLELSSHLEFLPLAIKQAASSISSMSISIEVYLHNFSENEQNQQTLLQTEFRDLTRATDVSNAVILTWRISFEQVQFQSSTASEMMALMSVLNREGIHEFMLKHIWSDGIQFIRDFGLLLSFSLIGRNSDNVPVASMHRLVQMTVRAWLSQKGERVRWERKALEVILHLFRKSWDEARWPECKILYPHVQVVSEYKFSDEPSKQHREDLTRLLHQWEAPPPLSQLASTSSVRIFEATRQNESTEFALNEVLKFPKLEAWLRTNQRLLFMLGGPGTGKTTTSASIVRHLQKSSPRYESTVLYFFSDFTREPPNRSHDIFLDLIFQLCADISPVPDEVSTLLSETSYPKPITTSTFLSIMSSLSQRSRRLVYVVVDAVDACYDESQMEICLALIRLAHDSNGSNFHVLITGRRGQCLNTVSDSNPVIGMGELLVESADMRNYSHHLTKVMTLENFLGREAEQPAEVLDEWKLQIDNVLQLENNKLQRTPDDKEDHTINDKVDYMIMVQSRVLNAKYESYLRPIEHQHPGMTKLVLMWSVVSERPLTLDEMILACGPLPSKPENPAEKVEAAVLRRCSILDLLDPTRPCADGRQVLRMDEEALRYLRLYRGNIESPLGFSEGDAQSAVLRKCLETLLEFGPHASEETPQPHGLLPYAAQFWPIHFNKLRKPFEAAAPSDILELAEKLFGSPAAYQGWLRVYDPAQPIAGSQIRKLRKDFPSMSYYIDLLELPPELKSMNMANEAISKTVDQPVEDPIPLMAANEGTLVSTNVEEETDQVENPTREQNVDAKPPAAAKELIPSEPSKKSRGFRARFRQVFREGGVRNSSPY